ncbi:MAG TPA: hypothetical protein VJK03_01370 [Candidatus Nanoarchaeia archaeon]|nr:hypothetical protein [Candidatus Nanoarchaeia archaeon]
MSDGIWYNGRMIGSVHYVGDRRLPEHPKHERFHRVFDFVYSAGKLSGRKGDIFVRMKDIRTLEILLQLSPNSKLRVGGEDKSHEVEYWKFKEEVLSKMRDVHIQNNAVGADVS